MYSAAYSTVYYEEPLKSFKIGVEHSPGFGLPFIAMIVQKATQSNIHTPDRA